MSLLKKVDKTCVWIFLILFVSDDTVMFGTNSNSVFVLLKYAFILFTFVYFYIKANKNKIGKSPLQWLIVMSILILLSALYSGDFSFGYVYKIMLLCIGLFYTRVVGLYTFMKSFVEVLYFLCLYSIFFHVIGIINHSFIELFPTIVNSTDGVFYNMLFTTWADFGDKARLFGPFREPGVYQMFINLALLFHLVSTKNLNYKKILTFIVAIILTMSTTGYIVMAFVLLFIFTLDAKEKGIKKSQLLLIEGIVVIGAVGLYLFTDLLSAEGAIFDKLGNSQRTTTAARMGSIICNYQIFKTSPIFGVGLQELMRLFPNYCIQYFGVDTEHNTNVLLIQFATHGLLYGAIWTYLMVRFFVFLSRSIIGKYLLVLAFLALCCGENLSWSIILYILLFYGVNNKHYFNTQLSLAQTK